MISYGDEVHDLKELLAEGFADKQRLRDIERNHAQVTGEVAALSSEIAGNEIQIGETKLQILQLQKSSRKKLHLNSVKCKRSYMTLPNVWWQPETK